MHIYLLFMGAYLCNNTIIYIYKNNQCIVNDSNDNNQAIIGN